MDDTTGSEERAHRRALGVLASTAALVHTFPHLRARVLVGGRPVLDVRRSVDDDFDIRDVQDPAVPAMTPCTFRDTVVRARDAGDLDAVLALGVPLGTAATVELGLPEGGCMRPGGLQRIPVEGRWVWAVTTTLAADDAYRAGADIVDAALPIPGLVAMAIHPDTFTGVSVAYAITRAAPGSGGEAVLVELFEALIARWTAQEITRLVATVAGPH